MAKTYNKLLMDVNGKNGDIVTEVQGDQNSRYLDIYLFNNGIPIDLTGHTVRIYMRRPHTNPLEEFFNDGEITEAARGRCQFLLSTQALAKEGELEAQVSIWKGTEEILSTQVFKINVTKKLRTSGSVESSNEYGALVVLFQNLYEAHDLMTTMVQNIGNPSEIAAQYNLATMWQAWEFLTDYMKTDLTNMIEQAIANASVQGVLDKIGTPTAEGDTLFSKLETPNPVIKHIQRGKVNIKADNSEPYNDNPTEVYLTGFTNLNKMVVIINGYMPYWSSTNDIRPAYIYELTVNRLKFLQIDQTNINGVVSYQVIEFY